MKIILGKKSKHSTATKKTCIWVSAAISRYLPFQKSGILQQTWPNKIPSSCEFKWSELILPYLILHLRSGSILKACCTKMFSLVLPTMQRESVWYSVSSFHFKKLLLIKLPLDVSFKLSHYNTILIKREIAVAVQLIWGSGHVCQVNYNTNTEHVEDSSSWKCLWNLPSKSRSKEMDKFFFFKNQALFLASGSHLSEMWIPNWNLFQMKQSL